MMRPTRAMLRTILVSALTVATFVPAPGGAQTVAITGGTIFTVSGDPIENGVVLIESGRITDVGSSVTIPAGARRVDATGKWVTPGFIAAFTQLGLVEISAVSGTREGSLAGADIAAAFNVLEGINPASQLIPAARIDGITTAISGPSGGLIAGQAVAIDLDGDRIEVMRIESPVAMVAALNEGSKSAAGGSRAGAVARLRAVLDDAREYGSRRSDYRAGRMQELSAPAADLEALLPVLGGDLPLLLEASRRSDMESALRIARDYDLELIIIGAEEGWQIADRLAAAGVAVIIDPMADIPSYDAPSPHLNNAALLSAAGVRVAIISSSLGHNVRNLRQSAGKAVAYGMDWDAALRAVTLAPAQAFGIDDRYGTLEAGKVADVVIWSGDPFEFSTGVEAVFIRGREIPLVSRQTELLERYRRLPPTAG